MGTILRKLVVLSPSPPRPCTASRTNLRTYTLQSTHTRSRQPAHHNRDKVNIREIHQQTQKPHPPLPRNVICCRSPSATWAHCWAIMDMRSAAGQAYWRQLTMTWNFKLNAWGRASSPLRGRRNPCGAAHGTGPTTTGCRPH